jgi:hypothetical protein
VWALWADPERWERWNEQVERVDADGDIRVGAEIGLKLRRGGTIKYEVAELEPERLLAYEAKLPGARLRHEHRLAPGRSSVEVTHRISLAGPMSGFWALMMGRKRMRESVARFVERERQLTEPRARR